jgi:hypothetical protein
MAYEPPKEPRTYEVDMYWFMYHLTKEQQEALIKLPRKVHSVSKDGMSCVVEFLG